VISGSTVGPGGGDPTTVRSGTIALFASGMGLLTAKSGSLDPNAVPLHVLVISGSVLGTATAGDPTTIRSGTIALFASGMGLFTGRSGALDPNTNPLHVFIVSGSVVGGAVTVSNVVVQSGLITVVSGRVDITDSDARAIGEASLRASQLVLGDNQSNNVFMPRERTVGSGIYVPVYPFAFGGSGWDRLRNVQAFGVTSGMPLAVGFVSGFGDRLRSTTISGSVTNIGRFAPFLTSGEEEAFAPVSGQYMPPTLDRQGRLIVRIDRPHFIRESGGFYSHIHMGEVLSGGDTVLMTPGSGRAIRVMALEDTYRGTSGEVTINYRFVSGNELYMHKLTPTNPNFGINLVGVNFQGDVNLPIVMNLRYSGTPLTVSGLSGGPLGSGLGVHFTLSMEEVGSGAVF